MTIKIPTLPSARQTLDILTHLQRVGGITNVEAQSLYKCRALPRRIADLRALNWPIVSQMKTDITGQRYARYAIQNPATTE